MAYYQHPMTQNAVEERRKREDLPCSRLQSEMLVEGMMDDAAENCHWMHIAVGILIVGALGAAVFYYVRYRKTDGVAPSEGTDAVISTAPSKSALWAAPQAAQPATAPTTMGTAEQMSFGDTTASYFF